MIYFLLCYLRQSLRQINSRQDLLNFIYSLDIWLFPTCSNVPALLVLSQFSLGSLCLCLLMWVCLSVCVSLSFTHTWPTSTLAHGSQLKLVHGHLRLQTIWGAWPSKSPSPFYFRGSSLNIHGWVLYIFPILISHHIQDTAICFLVPLFIHYAA